MSQTRMGLAMGLLTLAGCAPAPPAVDVAAEAESMMAADRAFNDDTATNGVDGWVPWFAEDGMMVVPGARIQGHEAIREAMTPALSDGRSLTWDPTRAHLSASADLGYTVGRYESRSPGPDGEEVVAAGTYVTIWKK